MKINLEQAQLGLLSFVDNEIGKKAVGWQKFATYFGMFAFKNKINKMLLSFKDNPLIKEIGIFDEDNNIDIDMLYNYSKEAIKHSGQFTLMGIIFNESDIDKLYEYLKNTSINVQ